MESECQMLHWDRLPAVWTDLECQLFTLTDCQLFGLS